MKIFVISLNFSGSYIDSPDWVKTKKATVNPINKYDKCFQYDQIVAWSHKEPGNNPQKNIKSWAFYK